MEEKIMEMAQEAKEATEAVAAEAEAAVKEAAPTLEVEVPALVVPGEIVTAGSESVKILTAEAEAVNIEDRISLSPEEQKAVDSFVEKIDISNSTHILNYGADAQGKIAEFSDTALERVRTKDLGDVGNTLTDLVVELKGFDPTEESGGFLGLFKKAKNSIEGMKARYSKVETNVNNVVDVLEGHQITLTKDIAILDEMFRANTGNFKQLSMYIVAGKKKLEEAQNVTLVELKKKAEQTGDPQDAQAANDFANLCNRFEKRLHDLDLTRTVSLQMGPQIRLIQNNDTLMVEKIQTTLVNTIPLWKSQMVLALGLAHSEDAMKAQRAVSETTNELLRKNAEMLKTTTVGVAEESERGIVDIETLQHTNNMLIETLDEVVKIQNDGRQKRRAAEAELQKIESNLKAKLIEFKG